MSWLDRAACQGMDAPLFFGPDGEARPEREIREARAKAVCKLCPVLVPCLDYALRNSIRYGIWAGSTERNGRVNAAAGHAGRPPRDLRSAPQVESLAGEANESFDRC